MGSLSNVVVVQQNNGQQHFFEGAEKLLEVWFDSSIQKDASDESDDDDNASVMSNASSTCSSRCCDNDSAGDMSVGELSSSPGASSTGSSAAPLRASSSSTIKLGATLSQQPSLSLRSIPRRELDRLVELANAQIIGHVSNACVDSYVLSESSLFVSERRVLLKTCGTTSLLSALRPLLQMAAEYCGLDKVVSCNYSRRNFTRPELQPSFHQNFEEEIQFLTEIFQGGSGYCMGKINHDRWYLYNYTPDPLADCMKFQDQTIEILMSNLDPDVMKIFSQQISSSAVEARKLSGIDKLMPNGTLIDDKLFDPCGYSLNALFADKDEYYTIHITPEDDYSYVSFETNAHCLCYTDLVQQVVDTFKPGTFLVTLYGNEWSNEARLGQQDLWSKPIRNYKRNDLQLLALPDSSLVLYGQYTSVVNNNNSNNNKGQPIL